MENIGNNKTYGLFESAFNRQLIDELEAKDLKIYKFPQVETKKSELTNEAKIYLKNLLFFDCIIFTDVLTARYFLETLEENEIDLFILDEVRILTYGEAVADELRLSQIHADIIPLTIDTATVISSLKNYCGTEYCSNLKILILHERFFKPDISGFLIEDNLEVCEIGIYEIIPKKINLTKLKIILQSGGIDEFLLTSPLDLIAIKNYFADLTYNEIFQETKVRAKDEAISKLLSENNIKHFIRNE